MKIEGMSGDPIPSQVQRYGKIAVVGSGSWGTALAAIGVRSGSNVSIWGRSDAVSREINKKHTNQKYLPDVVLPKKLHAALQMEDALDGADAVMIVVPSHSIRSVARQVAEHADPCAAIAICAKGIESETGLLMTQVAEEELGDRPIGVVSGPTFARESALNYPTAATVAFPFRHADRLSPHASPAARFAVSLSTEAFRAYVSDDTVGVEVGGAVKNVIAIACGMMTGAGFGENTRAALITRGLDEMKVLAESLGGRRETVTGLSGIGDLCLTCSSATSRNMALGHQLGSGVSREACFDGHPVVVEGEFNAKSVTDLARRVGVRMPICEAVRAILHEDANLGATFAALWSRPIQAEPRAMALSLDHPAQDRAIAELAGRIS